MNFFVSSRRRRSASADGVFEEEEEEEEEDTEDDEAPDELDELDVLGIRAVLVAGENVYAMPCETPFLKNSMWAGPCVFLGALLVNPA